MIREYVSQNIDVIYTIIGTLLFISTFAAILIYAFSSRRGSFARHQELPFYDEQKK